MFAGGREFKGEAVGFAPDELRVELELSALLAEHEDVELELRWEGGGASLHGRVLERVLPLAAAPPSVLVKLDEAPRQYHEWLATLACPAQSDRGPGASRVAPERARALFVGPTKALADLKQLVAELGGTAEQRDAGALAAFGRAEDAPRALVVDASVALSLEIPEDAREFGVVSLAVVSNSNSEVLSNLLWRLGFDYVVRRPAHAEVLRLLFRRALHRGGDRRVSERVPIGRAGWLRAGLRRRRCTVLDLSEGGCLLALRGSVEMLAPVTIELGPTIMRGRSLRVRGRVVRRRADGAAGETTVALRFLDPDASARKRIRGVLARRVIGPTPGQHGWLARLLPWRRRESIAPLPGPGANPGSAGKTVGHAPDGLGRAIAEAADRRENPRVRLHGEVLSLRAGAVDRVLIGRDLSRGGMRVEPHPDLLVGERLVLSLFDAVAHEPLIFEARVLRDDGERGLALRFDRLEPETGLRLDQLIGGLPTIEWLSGPGEVSPVFLASFEHAASDEPTD